MGLHHAEYDVRTPVTGHANLAVEQFLEYFQAAEGQEPVVNVASGRTHLEANLAHHGITTEVVNVDPIFADQRNHNVGPRCVAAVAQHLPFADETFAVSLMHYGLQHIDPNGRVQSLREMVRVTATAEHITDDSRGTILVGPVFGYKALTEAIFARGLQSVCGVQRPPARVRDPAARHSLIIKKTPALAEHLDELVTLIGTSDSMTTRRTAGEWVSRLLGGYSKY